jgi:hypothetical protein
MRTALVRLFALVLGVPACGAPSAGDPPPESTGGYTGAVTCDLPGGQVVAPIHAGAELKFSTETLHSLLVGSTLDLEATEPDDWLEQGKLGLPASGALKVFARLDAEECSGRFEHTYQIVSAYSGPAGSADSEAVAMDDPRLVGWASSSEDYETGTDLGSTQDPKLALGPALGTSFDVVSLGNGGRITLVFDPPIRDGEGPDFAVFENAFNDTFLELAFVEVSSDGVTFARFDSAYLGEDPVAAYGSHSPSLIQGLAGKHRQGHGTPFDLSWLRYRPEVKKGSIDLASISHVRIVDIIGDGATTDSFGRPVYDPHPATGAAGFDLDAVGALHLASDGPE